MEFKYVNELMSSFGEIFRKPILMLPFVYIFVLSTIFLFLTPASYIEGTEINYNALVWIIGLAIIQGILALAFKSMGLIGIRDYVDEKEVLHKNQVQGGLKIFWKVLLLTIFQVIIVAVPVVIIFAIYFGLLAINPIVANVVGILLLILLIIYVLFALYYLMFSNVIIAYDGKSATQSLADSYNYAKQNPAHTIFTLLTLFVSGLVLLIVLMLLYLPFMFSTSTTMMYAQQIGTALISVPLSAAFTLFIFKAFNNGPGKNGKENKVLTSAPEMHAEKKEAKSRTIPSKKLSALRNKLRKK